MKKIGKLVIKKVKLNNKSRKGDYIYIHEPGKKASYYKAKKGVDLDSYMLAYEGKVRSKRSGVKVKEKVRPVDLYLKKIKTGKRIDDFISKGITEVSVNNLKFVGKAKGHEIYKKLLSPLVDDEDLLNILALDENINKIKHRIEARVHLVSKDERVDIGLRVFNKTLLDIENDLKHVVKGRTINEGDLGRLFTEKYMLDGIPKGVDITGSKGHVLTNELKRVDVKLKFVKG